LTKEDLIYFELLKKEVTASFNKNTPSLQPIEEWKGAIIVSFQEDLFEKTKGRVSEKWFYTYCKNTPKKLPRIDILNLLSNYSGYHNWDDFIIKNKLQVNKILPLKNILITIIGIVLLVIMISFYSNKNEYHFCFYNEDTNSPIINTKINIEVLQPNESSIYTTSDSLGCFKYTTTQKSITFITSSPFFIKDTIVRNLSNNNNNSIVKLETDDYALMLYYYTNGNIKNWQERKKELENLIDNKAKIYQVFNTNIGIELYTKEDFINKLLIPTSGLKNIKILKKKYINNKIVTLKFMTK